MARISNSVITSLLRISTKASRNASPLIRLLIVGLTIIVIVLAVYGSPSKETGENQQPIPTTVPSGSYLVKRVVDGDTIVIEVADHSQTVRLIGIDTPEVVDPRQPVQCFGQEASKKLESLLLDKVVRLESDPTQDYVDKYGRWLRYVYLSSGTNINLLMIEQGFAYEYTFRSPYIQQPRFKAAQQQARQQEVGLWNPLTCNGQKLLK